MQGLGAEFVKAAPVLAGTTVASSVALLQDYSSRWAINWQRHNKAFDPVESLLSFYKPLQGAVRSVDIVADTAPLSGYKLVVAPALNLLTPAAIANLQAYVEGGGHLVLGPRSAMKDEDNGLFPARQPGPLGPMLGARVEQYYALTEPVPLSGTWTGVGGAGQSTLWAEQLGSLQPGTEVLLTYGKSNGWLDGQPAAVTRRIGKGRITYIGAAMDPATMKTAVRWMLKDAQVAPVLPDLPPNVDVAVRSGEGKRVFILTNYGTERQTIPLPGMMVDVLAGGRVSTVTLAQYGVAVLSTP